MTQTMFGLLAMVMAMLFAFHQQRTIMREYDDMVRGEMEIMASGVALEVLEHVAAHPFDAATADSSFILATDFDVSKLAPAPFQYQHTFEDAQYLEHFNGTQTDISFQAGTEAFPYQVSIAVHYLDSQRKPSNVRSDMKEVVVTVTHGRYARFLARLSRTISPTHSTSS